MVKRKRVCFSINEKIASQFRAKAYMKSIVMSRLVERLISDWIGDTFPQEGK